MRENQNIVYRRLQETNLIENKWTEFKQHRFVTSEYVRIDQQSLLKPFSPTLNGFINTEGGTLYAGINDKGIIKGIQLSYSQKLHVRMKITDMFNRFSPPVSTDMYSVKFKPVICENPYQENDQSKNWNQENELNENQNQEIEQSKNWNQESELNENQNQEIEQSKNPHQDIAQSKNQDQEIEQSKNHDQEMVKNPRKLELLPTLEEMERPHLMRCESDCWCDIQAQILIEQGIDLPLYIIEISVSTAESFTANEESKYYLRGECSNSQHTLKSLKDLSLTQSVKPKMFC